MGRGPNEVLPQTNAAPLSGGRASHIEGADTDAAPHLQSGALRGGPAPQMSSALTLPTPCSDCWRGPRSLSRARCA
eukprot:906634-Pyramimonas_sp.AAC.1